MIADRVYRLVTQHKRVVLASVVVAIAAAGFLGAGIRIDMSFRPTFSTNRTLVNQAAAHDARFGEVGFNDLVAIVTVGDVHDRTAMAQVADLAARLSRLGHMSTVRDPTSVPMFDRLGAFVPQSLRDPSGRLLDDGAFQTRVDDLLASRQLRRLVVSDDARHLAVSATVDLPNQDFHGRGAVVRAFTDTVSLWARQTGLAATITGYPQVEQAYAREVLRSVLIVIAVLYLVMIVVLLAYFGRWRDVLVTLSGVSAAVPLVLAEMRLLGQPFSIVNSQVLTLVVIVGVAHALHHVEEYRRRREVDLEHGEANRSTFKSIAFPSLMTGFSVAIGFLALRTADMPAVRSFGLSTAAGVATVYCMNWLLVPMLVDVANRGAGAPAKSTRASRGMFKVLGATADSVDRRPWRLVAAFAVTLAALGVFGLPRLSVNQLVNEELHPGHPVLQAQQLYERQFSGFLGPELWLRPAAGDVLTNGDRLARLVNGICALPNVRFISSPLDLVPQPPLTATADDSPCRRSAALAAPLAALRPLADTGPAMLRSLVHNLLGSSNGNDITIVVRIRDIGTAHTLPFVDQVRRVARDALGTDVTVTPVGQWWLAQNGINRLSVDIGFASVSALALILPIMLLTIRDRRLFLAAILPTIMPVAAALAFMGLADIPLRIGTAMILAISLGLAADDTIYLSMQIKRRIAAGNDPASALHATLRRTGRPCCYSSIVLICGFLSMTASSLVALQDMGIVAAFTMLYALATDILLGPAIYRLLLTPTRWAIEGGTTWASAPVTT